MNRLLIAALVVIAPIASHAGTYTFTDNTDFNDILHGTAYTWGFTSLTTGHNTGALSSLETAISAPGQTVTSATLTITGINDWTSEPADVLYVNLLNNVSTAHNGVNSYDYDNSPDNDDTTFGVDPFVSNSSTTSSYYEITHGLGFPTSAAAVNNSLLVYTAADGAVFTGAHPNDVTNPGTWSDPIGGGGPGDSFTLSIQLTAANLQVLNSFLTSDAPGGSDALADLGIGLGPDCHYTIDGLSLSVITGAATVPDGGMTVALLGLALIGLAGMSRLTRRSLEA